MSIQNPVALVFDEYDAGRPDVMFVIQRVLESDGKFTLLDKNKHYISTIFLEFTLQIPLDWETTGFITALNRLIRVKWIGGILFRH